MMVEGGFLTNSDHSLVVYFLLGTVLKASAMQLIKPLHKSSGRFCHHHSIFWVIK